MSDITTDRARAELDETFRRIEKQQAEIGKLMAEQSKLMAEQGKLLVEGRKFNRDPWLLALGAMVIVLAARLPEVLAFIANIVHPYAS